MFLQRVKLDSNIIRVLAHHVKEQALQVHELCVVGVILPGGDLNSILCLAAEVLLDVVDDNCFA